MREILSVTGLNLRNLGERWASSLVSVIGIAGVVLVLCATLAINAGFRRALDQAGARDIAVVTRGGADAELSSVLSGPEATVIQDAEHVSRRAGRPVSSPELYVLVDLPIASTGTAANVPFRGVGPQAAAVRSHFHLVAGRMFTPGLFEIIVGRGAQASFAGLVLGREVRFGSLSWRVVGVFEDGGSVTETEVWADAPVLQGAYRRGNSLQSVRMKLARPEDIAPLAAELKADPRLNVSVRSEAEFYAGQSKVLTTLVTTLGGAIAFLMGVGAVFGALNTMYSAVAARTREIATLRALGFGGPAVLASVLAEALVLGLAGGALGGTLAYLGFNGLRATTLNFQTFSQLSFAFAVTPAVLVSGIGYALLLGLLGGLAPGARAAAMPITQGLRA